MSSSSHKPRNRHDISELERNIRKVEELRTIDDSQFTRAIVTIGSYLGNPSKGSYDPYIFLVLALHQSLTSQEISRICFPDSESQVNTIRNNLNDLYNQGKINRNQSENRSFVYFLADNKVKSELFNILQIKTPRSPVMSHDLISELRSLPGINDDGTGTVLLPQSFSRESMYNLLIKNATEEIYFVGIGNTNLTKDGLLSADAILGQRKMREQVKKRFLMLDPRVFDQAGFEDIMRHFLGWRNDVDIRAMVEKSLEEMKKYCTSNKLQSSFRVYSSIPSASLMMIDPQTENCTIALEVFLYQIPKPNRPHLILYPVEKVNSLYSSLKDSILALWNTSRIIFPA